jgi:anti-anti-sigma factor
MALDNGTQTPAGTEISLTETGSRVLARLRGPFDSYQGGRFLERLRATCRERRSVVLDLRGADYIDSDGVRLLLQLRSDVELCRGELRLVLRPRGPVERTLSVLELLGSFRTSHSVAEAWTRR